jgi:pullulanase/glycogen debranching enzyme
MRITKFNFSVIFFNQSSVGSTVISITFVLGLLENTSSLNHTRKSKSFLTIQPLLENVKTTQITIFNKSVSKQQQQKIRIPISQESHYKLNTSKKSKLFISVYSHKIKFNLESFWDITNSNKTKHERSQLKEFYIKISFETFISTYFLVCSLYFLTCMNSKITFL